MALSRRAALTGSLAVTVGAALSTAGCDRRERRIGLVDLERRHGARIGAYARDLVSGHRIVHRADDFFAICSTFKAYAAGRVLQLADARKLTLDDAMTIAPGDVVEYSPVTGQRVGGSMTLAELCRAALQQSDNTAGNLLLRTIGGPPAITAFARSIGDDRTRLDRWETDLNSAVPGDPRDTSTPTALAAGYTALLTGDILGAGRREQLARWMLGNETSSMRPGLPAGWSSADKTGGGDYGTTNDVGVVFGPGGRRVVVAIMIRSAGDEKAASNFRDIVPEVARRLLAAL
ncbi:MAG: class A beta-lactamase [Gordonia sp. (in: high G+C Gram-positive bacteria)]|uniref:class A beta-lactamase n=1 Tax=Gordonia sp. (in: high G+C Gram-positive bacteria) TaxID=84139 RepID=UPI0039E64D67